MADLFTFRRAKRSRSPIHLLYISTGNDAGTTTHPRNLIVAEKGSQATVLESYVSTADASYFTNAVTELIAGDGRCSRTLQIPGRSAERVSHRRHPCAPWPERQSDFALLRDRRAAVAQQYSHTLAGEGVECILNGLYLTRGEQLADHHMVVEHAQPHCNSHEYYNGILDDQSKGVFHGRILVRQIAQKTDAKQTNKNLLLSDDATVDTKPQLEIYADDVKCTHGATIGQLNDESIFYLRARGIGVETARRMLIHAFAGEIIERIRHRAAREELDKIVWDRLEQTRWSETRRHDALRISNLLRVSNFEFRISFPCSTTLAIFTSRSFSTTARIRGISTSCPTPTCSAQGHNPLCGDQLKLFLANGWRRYQGHQLHRFRLLHFQSLRFVADR